jgi:hypothetical protein
MRDKLKQKEYNKKYRFVNAEAIKAQKKAYACFNKDKISTQQRRWREKNLPFQAILGAKRRMKKMGLTVEITKDDFNFLMHQPCSYCGKIYKINSVDRIDSKKGYLKDNVQPICYRCNIMKSNLTHKDFLEHIKNIALFTGSIA